MAHISLLCYHDKEGKLISHGTSRKTLCLSGKGLCMRQGSIHTPSVHVPLTLYCLHTHSFTLLWNDCFSVVVLLTTFCVISCLLLNSKEENSSPATVQSSTSMKTVQILSNLLFLFFHARPGFTQGYPFFWCHWHIHHCSLVGSKCPGGQLQSHLCASTWRSVFQYVTPLFKKKQKLFYLQLTCSFTSFTSNYVCACITVSLY